MGSLMGKHEGFFGVVGGPFLLSTRGGDALAFLHLKLMTEFPNTPAYALRLYLPFPPNNCLPVCSQYNALEKPVGPWVYLIIMFLTEL